MSREWLTLSDLIAGLERFSDRYQTLNVFADDIRELSLRSPIRQLQPVGSEGRLYRLSSQDGQKSYHLEFFPELGIARVSADVDQKNPPDGTATLSGSAIDAIKAAEKKKGKAAALGLLLGLLVGTAFKNRTDPGAPRRVFTLKFNAKTHRWEAYDGGLVRWMKEQLIPPTAAAAE
jgi:hypothetical protein